MHCQRMRKHACAVSWIVVFGAALAIAQAQPVAQTSLIGVEHTTGTLYNISKTDASLVEIGQTGLSGLGALEFNPADGLLYGMTSGQHAALYRIEISPSLDDVLSVDLIGELGIFAFEGGLAFAPDGTAYALNGGVTQAALMTLDLNTGAATAIGLLEGRHDIAGLGWRDDGVLVGLDSTTGTLITIDPSSIDPNTSIVATAWIEDSALVGSLGGMVIAGDEAYYTTANRWAQSEGSNGLFWFDPSTGVQAGRGTFASLDINNLTGISGLAITPEPATLSLLLLGGLAILYRRVR